jgi:ribosome-associated toxin RatA of RatAB toxin-antitoxin module
MGKIEGSETAEIDAPIERCYAHAADVDRISEWQGGVQQVEVLQRDEEGRVLEAKISNDAKVRTVTTTVRFSYDDPPRHMSWSQTKGDLKTLDGEWTLEDLGDGRTRATYHLVGDPGRVLGMLVRGPVEGRIRDHLVKARPGELKRRAEAG